MSDGPVRSSSTWHDAQPSVVERLLAGGRVGLPGVAAGGDGQGAGVEGDLVELAVVELGLAAVGRAEALRLQPRAGLLGAERRGDADVAGERAGVLLLDGRDGRLPSEAAEHGVAVGVVRVGDDVGAARDAVAVGIVGVGEGEDVVGGHAFEQADAEHRRGDAGRQEEVGDRLAVGVEDLVVGLDQRVRRAVGVLAGLLDRGDDDRALDGHAADGAVLQLVAERAVGLRTAVLPEDAEPDQQAALGIVGVGGGLGAAVAEVARRARLGVEQRAEPVAPVGRRRRGDPVVVEEAVADRERAPLLAVEAGHRLGEGAGAEDVDGGVAALVGQLLGGGRPRRA